MRIDQVLDYEIRASWWATLVSWGPAQDLVGRYFAWKVKRKWDRWFSSRFDEAYAELLKKTEGPEFTTPLITVKVRRACYADVPSDNSQTGFTMRCGGEMVQSNDSILITTFPPKYLHQCTMCKREEMYTVSYPSIQYKDA